MCSKEPFLLIITWSAPFHSWSSGCSKKETPSSMPSRTRISAGALHPSYFIIRLTEIVSCFQFVVSYLPEFCLMKWTSSRAAKIPWCVHDRGVTAIAVHWLIIVSFGIEKEDQSLSLSPLLMSSALVLFSSRSFISESIFLGICPVSISWGPNSGDSPPNSASVVPASSALIWGPWRLKCRVKGLFCRARRRNEYKVGALATKVAARNSPVVHVILFVSEVASSSVLGSRTPVTAMMTNPTENKKPSCAFLARG